MADQLFADLPRQVSLERQLAAVQRELGMRRAVFPRRVLAGKMAQSEADEELAAMEAVLATLRRIRSGS